MQEKAVNLPKKLSLTQRYKPLIVIIVTIAFSATALALIDGSVYRFMENFMGLFFVNFAMFKLIDLKGFAKGFSMYDLIAKRSRSYALAFPFIELGIGLLYLASLFPIMTNILTLLLMLISGAGVVKAILTDDKHLQCACLGTSLNIPLSTVSLIENFGMALMASFMLWQSWG